MSINEVLARLATPVNIYCERAGPGLFAEPLNATTNCAFFIAAAAFFTLAHRRRTLDAGIWALFILAIAIGMGSTLFHTFATIWAQILDVVPILIFQLVFLWLYLARVVRLRPVLTTVLTLAFLGVALWMRQFKVPMNGSVPYLPALGVLLALGVFHFMRCKQERGALLAAAVAFSAALLFRSIDMLMCPTFPYGTHFLWHLFIATALYFSARALILNQRPLASDGPRRQMSSPISAR